MGIEFLLDPPRQEGRVARLNDRESPTIVQSAPERTRGTADFAAIFQSGLAQPVTSQPPQRLLAETKEKPAPDTTPPQPASAEVDLLIDGIEDADSDILQVDTEVDTEVASSDPPNAAPDAVETMTDAELLLPETAIIPVGPRSSESGSTKSQAAESLPQSGTLQSPHPPNAGPTAPPVVPIASPVQTALLDRLGNAEMQEILASRPGAALPAAGQTHPPHPPHPVITKSPPRAANNSEAAARFSAVVKDSANQSARAAPLAPAMTKTEATLPTPNRMLDLPSPVPVKEASGGVSQRVIPTATISVLSPALAEPPFTSRILIAAAAAEPTLQRGDQQRLAAHVGAQIVQAAATHGPNTELHLNPVELGRVRLSVQAIDSTIIVAIIADRPETADLMRRHVDTLTQEFRALGYQDVNVSIGGRQTSAGQGHDPDTRHNQRDAPAAESEAGQTPQPPNSNRSGLSASGGLDLRL